MRPKYLLLSTALFILVLSAYARAQFDLIITEPGSYYPGEDMAGQLELRYDDYFDRTSVTYFTGEQGDEIADYSVNYKKDTE